MITEADADTKALLPCPFCGGEGRVMLPTLPMVADCTDVVVYCVECNVCGPGILFDQTQQTASDLPDVEAEAIAAWNRRPALSMQSREAVAQRAECTQFITDPCGSSKCAGCGRRRAEHLARRSPQ